MLYEEVINPHWFKLMDEQIMDFIRTDEKKCHGPAHWLLWNEATLKGGIYMLLVIIGH